MYNCPLHNWLSLEGECPTCRGNNISTATTDEIIILQSSAPNPTVDKEAIYEKYFGTNQEMGYLPHGKESVLAAMESYSKELREELDLYKKKVGFYRGETDKCREFVFGRNDIGEPCQPIWDAVHDKLTQLQSSNEELRKEIEQLKSQQRVIEGL